MFAFKQKIQKTSLLAGLAAGAILSMAAGGVAAADAGAGDARTALNFDRVLIRAAEHARQQVIREQRQRQRRQAAASAAAGPVQGVPRATLDAIAACESGGDPTAVNSAGYYGKYQFSVPTWNAVGGKGNPAEASEAEQDLRAAILYNRSGPGQWPVCGV